MLVGSRVTNPTPDMWLTRSRTVVPTGMKELTAEGVGLTQHISNDS